MTTMDAVVEGPEVIMKLAYTVRGASLMQSRRCRKRDGVLFRSKWLVD